MSLLVARIGRTALAGHSPLARRRRVGEPAARRGFTLIEMMVAVALTMLMMTLVVAIFTQVSGGMRIGRSGIELDDRLRTARHLLQSDLSGVTVAMLPPRSPEQGQGYFEYIEGPIGPIVAPHLEWDQHYDQNGTLIDDTTIGDTDDILLFTTRSHDEPFLGLVGGVTRESRVAEVAWFVRGKTLYRRVLLVLPELDASALATPFYRRNDLSARQEGGANYVGPVGSATARLVANSLGDLTKRENRYGHQPWAYPHSASFWGLLGLPTLRESAAANWPFPLTTQGAPSTAAGPSYGELIIPAGQSQVGGEIRLTERTGYPLTASRVPFDFWSQAQPQWDEIDPTTGELNNFITATDDRVAEDVVLTNVLGFNVQVWDPGAPILIPTGSTVAVMPGDPGYLAALSDWKAAVYDPGLLLGFGAYVDLNYMCGLGAAASDPNYPDYDPSSFGIAAPQPFFHHAGDPGSGLRGNEPGALGPRLPAVYDTWSTHYGRDGLDNDGDGDIDEAGEAPPPYSVPLRGIRVRIRVFEPDSRQIREVTVIQDFLKD